MDAHSRLVTALGIHTITITPKPYLEAKEEAMDNYNATNALAIAQGMLKALNRHGSRWMVQECRKQTYRHVRHAHTDYNAVLEALDAVEDVPDRKELFLLLRCHFALMILETYPEVSAVIHKDLERLCVRSSVVRELVDASLARSVALVPTPRTRELVAA
jgi:hypothetical protein